MNNFRAMARSFGAGVPARRCLHRCFCSNSNALRNNLTACESSNGHELDGKPSLLSDANQCDVAIVGGGMVGMAVACALGM